MTENFESTHTVAILMRHTGKIEEEEKKQEAIKNTKGPRAKAKGAFSSGHKSGDTAE